MAYPNPPKTWAFQEGVESSELNAQLRDALLFLQPKHARKSGDQSVVSSTTFVDATGMSFAIGASETYFVHLSAFFQISGAGDLKTRWTVPSGATGHAWVNAATLSGQRVAVAADLVLGATGTSDYPTDWYAIVINSTTPGTVQFQFAQFASDATAAILRDNAALIPTRIA